METAPGTPSPAPAAGSAPGFGRSRAAPSPARISPPPAPSPPLSGSRGRAAPPPAAASGAPRRPEERHGVPAGRARGRGLGGRTCERTRAAAAAQRSGRAGQRRPGRRAQVRARGWCAVVRRTPFPGQRAPSLGKTPKSESPLGQTSANRGAALAQKSPLPLPVPSSEPRIRGGGSAAGKPPFSGWDPQSRSPPARPSSRGAGEAGALGPGTPIQGRAPILAVFPADSPLSTGYQS